MSALKSLLEKSLVSSNPHDRLRKSGLEKAPHFTMNSLSPNLKKSSSASANDAVFRLGAYIRLSPSDEIRDEGSLVSHPQRIESYVTYKNMQQPGWGVIVELYIDKDNTAANMKRPALLRMLQDIKLGRINAVIATELSRFSRNVKDFLEIWDFLKSGKCQDSCRVTQLAS